MRWKQPWLTAVIRNKFAYWIPACAGMTTLSFVIPGLSRNPVDHCVAGGDTITNDERLTAEERQSGFAEMIELALETAVADSSNKE